jgi:hypothetical protein
MAALEENRAWAHARYLVEEIGARGSGTPAEKHAAIYVQDLLEGWLIPHTVEDFSSPASAWRPFAVGYALAALAVPAALIPAPAGPLLAILLLLLSLWLNIREALLKDTFLRRLLPQVDSLNVIGRMEAAEKARQTLVLVAHLDSHRTPYFHRSRKRQRWFSVLLILSEIGVFLNLALFGALALGGPRWLWWLALPAGLLHLALALSCARADATPYSPGANDNAAAVGTALAVAERLREEPLLCSDLWLLFSGCEEVGAYGMRAFLETYGPALAGARFIDLEMVGQGIPGIVTKEGLYRRVNYDPWLIEEAAAAAREAWREPFFKEAHAYGESVVTQRAGFASVTLNSVLESTGKTAVWHRMDDDMSALSPETVANVTAWVEAYLRRLDADAGS